MDPIEHGTEIFGEIAREFGSERIQNPQRIAEFFERLLSATGGLVILDFLDAANWDRIEGFSLDGDILTLVYHDFRDVEEDEVQKEMRRMVFPADRYLLSFAVRSLAPVVFGDTAIFLLNGHTKTLKEIRSMYSSGASEMDISDSSFFEKRVIRKTDEGWEVRGFHCTPIYSLAVVPKNFNFSSGDSRQLLFHYNMDEAVNRISSVVDSLAATDPADEDAICEKVNTARRIFESVLKIECCYRDVEIGKAYSQILLGDLMKLVKKAQSVDLGQFYGTIAGLLNEFSHDSGKPIVLERAQIAALLVQLYSSRFRSELGDYWSRRS